MPRISTSSGIPKILDYIPIVSTFSGLVRLFKLAHHKFETRNQVITAKLTKSWGDDEGKRGAIALIPIIGNLILGIHDHLKKSPKNSLIALERAQKIVEDALSPQTDKTLLPTHSLSKLRTRSPSDSLIVFDMPPEVIENILLHLDNTTLLSTRLVSKVWKVLSERHISYLPDVVIGKEMWEKLAKTKVQPPPLPENLDKILAENCPFNSGMKVRDTHILIYFPGTIDNRPHNMLRAYLAIEKLAKVTQTGSLWQTLPNSMREGWFLITKKVIPTDVFKAQQPVSIDSIAKPNYRCITNVEGLWITLFQMKLGNLERDQNYISASRLGTRGNEYEFFLKIINKQDLHIEFTNETPLPHEIAGTLAVRELPLPK